jgi:ATP-binding cassette subfamily A (ABC1) protein 3
MYEKLTVREHLRYFCRIKGLPEGNIPSTIDFYAKLLSLEPYLDKQAGVLSGGNKRKMCVAMAMVGNPRVGFFD